MNLLFIGDSITEGQGSGSYVEYIASRLPGHQVMKLGISGTTIGEYSPYPVEGDSLLWKLKSQEYIKAVKDADMIFLEYGANDASALLLELVTARQVSVALVKAVDAIRQLNPNAKLMFLVLSKSRQIVADFANSMVEYLSKYFAPLSIDFAGHLGARGRKWLESYTFIVWQMSVLLPVVSMIESTSFYKEHTAEDKLHPNNEGYMIIGQNVLNSIELTSKN